MNKPKTFAFAKPPNEAICRTGNALDGPMTSDKATELQNAEHAADAGVLPTDLTR